MQQTDGCSDNPWLKILVRERVNGMEGKREKRTLSNLLSELECSLRSVSAEDNLFLLLFKVDYLDKVEH